LPEAESRVSETPVDRQACNRDGSTTKGIEPDDSALYKYTIDIDTNIDIDYISK